MRLLILLAVAAGVVVLGVVISHTDLDHLSRLAVEFGWTGLAAVLGLSAIWYVNDVVAWLCTLPSVTPGWRSFRRLWGIQMSGEALNVATFGVPLAGEPVKATLLNRNLGVPITEAAASVILVQTITICAQIVFLAVGIALMIGADQLSRPIRLIADAGLAFLILSVGGLVFVQRGGLTSRFLGRWRWARRSARLRRVLGAIRGVENQLIAFYEQKPKAFIAAMLVQCANWFLQAVEIYLILHLLHTPVSIAQAWVIESAVVLVRSVLFMVPASIGAQEGVFLLVCGAITGSGTIGVGVALIRRAREVSWIGLGLLLGGYHALRARKTRA